MKRTYRNTLVLPLGGSLLTIFSLTLIGHAVYHLVTGTPMIVKSGKYDMVGHAATQQELIVSATLPIVFVVVGLMIVWCWKNMTIELDDREICQRGFFGNVTFRSTWGDLTEVYKRIGGRGLAFYVICGKSGQMEFANTEMNIVELMGQVKRKADHLDYSRWP